MLPRAPHRAGRRDYTPAPSQRLRAERTGCFSMDVATCSSVRSGCNGQREDLGRPGVVTGAPWGRVRTVLYGSCRCTGTRVMDAAVDAAAQQGGPSARRAGGTAPRRGATPGWCPRGLPAGRGPVREALAVEVGEAAALLVSRRRGGAVSREHGGLHALEAAVEPTTGWMYSPTGRRCGTCAGRGPRRRCPWLTAPPSP
jgi:hypothetical protein